MRIAITLIALLSAGQVCAWDGYDYSTGSFIEIESGNLVREGEEIEYYDYGDGSYHSGSVESFDSTEELEVLDNDTGELRTFEMDD